MSATTATLDTYELLEKIIAQLPPEDITKAQHVSKTWQKLIQGSKKIKEAHLLKPKSRALGCWEIPVYSNETQLRLHPALFGGFGTCVLNDGKLYARVRPRLLRPRDLDRLASMAKVMITDPPIINARMFHFFKSETDFATCDLYVRAGITIEHVVQVADAMFNAAKLRHGSTTWQMEEKAITMTFLLDGYSRRQARDAKGAHDRPVGHF